MGKKKKRKTFFMSHKLTILYIVLYLNYFDLITSWRLYYIWTCIIVSIIIIIIILRFIVSIISR